MSPRFSSIVPCYLCSNISAPTHHTKRKIASELSKGKLKQTKISS